MIDLIKEFFTLWTDMVPRLAELATEAKSLREFPGEISEDESVPELHERLVRTRQAQDRLEAIVTELGRVRARTRLAVSYAKDAYEEAEIAAMKKTRIGEYSSAKEREMTYKSAAFNEYRIYRQAEKKAAEVDEVYEYCLFKHRGLDSSRRDIDSRIRMLSVQSSLES